MAPSQPWSVGGTLAMIFTVLPEEVPLAVVSLTVTVFVVSSLPPMLQAVVPIASSEAATIQMMSRLRDITYLLLSCF
jgi:hypothetical protein